MLTFETTRDILDLVRDFHVQLGDMYHRVGDHAAKPRVKLLLDYMGRHEKHLAMSLAAYEDEVSQRILNTWFQFTPCHKLSAALESVALRDDMSAGEVVNQAMSLDDCLLNVYKEMAENAESREVAELFANLMRLEEREEVYLMREALDTEDV